MHECTDRKTLIYACDETHKALNSFARVFVFSCALASHGTVHTSYNLNVTRVYHACVDHEMHTLFCYTRVVTCVFISYTTNT